MALGKTLEDTQIRELLPHERDHANAGALPEASANSSTEKTLTTPSPMSQSSPDSLPDSAPPTPNAASTTTPNQPRPSFLTLPGEIRNLVYSHAQAPSYVNIARVGLFTPKIARANKQIRREWLDHYYEHSYFMLHMHWSSATDGHPLAIWKSWISRLSTRNTSMVRNLIFYFIAFVVKVEVAEDGKVEFKFRQGKTEMGVEMLEKEFSELREVDDRKEFLRRMAEIVLHVYDRTKD